jgi:hypothetical protein
MGKLEKDNLKMCFKCVYYGLHESLGTGDHQGLFDYLNVNLL